MTIISYITLVLQYSRNTCRAATDYVSIKPTVAIVYDT